MLEPSMQKRRMRVAIRSPRRSAVPGRSSPFSCQFSRFLRTKPAAQATIAGAAGLFVVESRAQSGFPCSSTFD